MSLRDTCLRQTEKESNFYTIEAQIEFLESDEHVKLILGPESEDVYAIVRESDIDAESIFPLGQLEDVDYGGKGFLLKVRKGSAVTLVYKGERHNLKLDEEQEPLIFPPLNTMDTAMELANECPTRVILWQLRCCGNNRLLNRRVYGVKTCNQSPGDSRCC